MRRIALPALGFANLRPATDWFFGRTIRERTVLGVGAAVLVVAIFLAGIWHPLAAARTAALARLDREDSLIATMRGNSAQLRALSLTAPPISAVPATTAITEEAAAQRITIQRLEREGTRLRVVVDNAEFPALIAWLSRLETGHGLRIAGLELERRPAPGVVSARITLEE